MPRKGNVPKRDVLPDPKFNDKVIAKLINKLTSDGKKSKAEKIIYGALETVEEKTKTESMKVFKKALENIKPILEVKSRRVGGATYQVPVEVRPDRKLSLALRWLVGYAKARSEKSMVEKLAGELIDASNSKGGSVKKKEDVHKMAEANKAFAHYRW
ncbi:MAG: 30S ribosomal protein S7 [Deltaproteobacteria bacterium]|nr:30S ribosomal protein S7 [Deltaproteobacteria bacterium]